MDRILVLNSSTSGVTSISRNLVEDAVARLLAARPDMSITRRDLGEAPVPHLGFGPEARGAAIEHARAQIGDAVAKISGGRGAAPIPSLAAIAL